MEVLSQFLALPVATSSLERKTALSSVELSPIRMSGASVKLKSSGFASYVPPGRRNIAQDAQIPSTVTPPSDEASFYNGDEDSNLRISSSQTRGKSNKIEPQNSGDSTNLKSTKKVCHGIPREYVPPSRRGLISDIPSQVQQIEKSCEGLTESEMTSEPMATPYCPETTEPSSIDRGTKSVRRIFSENQNMKYVPPARRALIAEETRLAAVEKALGIVKPAKIVSKKCDGFVPPPAFLPNFEDFYSDEQSVRRCCFIVRGLPPELPDAIKDRYLKCYTDRGGVVRWFSPVEAVLAFPTESITKSSLPLLRNSLIKIIPFQDLSEVEAESFLEVCTDIYNSIKPERDCRVANRMISAALGIPFSKKQNNRAKSPKKLDAWDD